MNRVDERKGQKTRHTKFQYIKDYHKPIRLMKVTMALVQMVKVIKDESCIFVNAVQITSCYLNVGNGSKYID